MGIAIGVVIGIVAGMFVVIGIAAIMFISIAIIISTGVAGYLILREYRNKYINI